MITKLFEAEKLMVQYSYKLIHCWLKILGIMGIFKSIIDDFWSTVQKHYAQFLEHNSLVPSRNHPPEQMLFGWEVNLTSGIKWCAWGLKHCRN